MNRKNSTKPVILAINICDDIIRDEISKKISLIGLFNNIKATSFPVTHSSLHVYVSLTNGHRAYDGELRFVNEKNSKVVFAMKGKVPLKNPLQVIELNFGIRNLEFKEAGNYSVQFYCDGTFIGSRRFMVSVPSSFLETKGA